MGETKTLLPFLGQTLLEFQIETLTAIPQIGQVLVVVGHRRQELLPLIQGKAKVRAVENPEYTSGRVSSIQAGLGNLSPDCAALLILGVDQPRPQPVIELLVREHLSGGSLITVPTYQGKRGHPTLFSSRLLPDLQAISEEKQGLREVMARYRGQTREVAVDSPTVLVDINTPERYQEALDLFTPGRRPG